MVLRPLLLHQVQLARPPPPLLADMLKAELMDATQFLPLFKMPIHGLVHATSSGRLFTLRWKRILIHMYNGLDMWQA